MLGPRYVVDKVDEAIRGRIDEDLRRVLVESVDDNADLIQRRQSAELQVPYRKKYLKRSCASEFCRMYEVRA